MPDVVPTRKAAAAALGVDERSLATWSKEPWFPADAVGKDAKGRNRNWNVTSIRAARDAAGRKGSDPQLDELTRRAKAKRAVEDAKKAELENEKRRLQLEREKRDLVPRAAAELFAATLLTGLADWCEQLPELAVAVVPKKYRRPLKDFLSTELDNRRRQLAADLESAAREHDAANRQEKTEKTEK